MPVFRYRDISDVPPAISAEDDMTPGQALRLACELSTTALRLAGTSAPPQRVWKLTTTTASASGARP